MDKAEYLLCIIVIYLYGFNPLAETEDKYSYIVVTAPQQQVSQGKSFGLPSFVATNTNTNTKSNRNFGLPSFGIFSSGSGSAKPHRSKNPPDDVVNYIRNTIVSRYPATPPWVYLAICYHERGVRNWRDQYLCGYRAFDGARSGWGSSGGWQYQLDNLARIINRDRRSGRFQTWQDNPNCHEYQMFAKHTWKTTAWQTHCNSASYAAHFKSWYLGKWGK